LKQGVADGCALIASSGEGATIGGKFFESLNQGKPQLLRADLSSGKVV